MSPNNEPLRKLIEAARKAAGPAPEPSESAAPFGFATRVAARWAAVPRAGGIGALFERASWWGAGAAVAVCALTVLTQPPAEPSPFDLLLDVPQAQAGLF